MRRPPTAVLASVAGLICGYLLHALIVSPCEVRPDRSHSDMPMGSAVSGAAPQNALRLVPGEVDRNLSGHFIDTGRKYARGEHNALSIGLDGHYKWRHLPPWAFIRKPNSAHVEEKESNGRWDTLNGELRLYPKSNPQEVIVLRWLSPHIIAIPGTNGTPFEVAAKFRRVGAS